MSLRNDKIDLDIVIKSIKVSNEEVFISYLKELWMDFSKRNEDNTIGISKMTFASYFNLPGILMDRLFLVLDMNKSGFLESKEFIIGMTSLFCGDFEVNSKFIFNFYDFDKDDKITKEDIRTVLSYITISQDTQTYKGRVHSQEELFDMLEKCFKEVSSSEMNYDEFKKIIENVNSDIYLLILLFLYEKKPFNNVLLSSYEKQKNRDTSPEKKVLNSPSKLLAYPTQTNLFSPYLTFNRLIQKRKSTLTQDACILNEKILKTSTIQRRVIKTKTYEKKTDEVVKLMPMGTDSTKQEAGILPVIKQQTTTATINTIPSIATETILSPVPLKRKRKIDLKQRNTTNSKVLSPNRKTTNANDNNETKIHPALNQINNITASKNVFQVGFSERESVFSIVTNEPDDYDEIGLNKPEVVQEEMNEKDKNEDILTYSGYLYKFTDNKVRKVWFKLIHKDLFFFKSNKDNIHKGMHNLSGTFIQEEMPKVLLGKSFYSFSLVFPTKTRIYYVDNESENTIWIEKLKKATEYTNLTDIYDIGEKIGNGKFGVIKKGIHITTRKEVAIKIMSKKDLSISDLELMRTEIEILKICQHPNIIQLYEVFENIDFFYIIMEYCSGGDLFDYLEKRKFKLSESKACEIMHKMFTSMYYVHSYGIAHRDLKPENVLMTSKDDDADIRILDFGLSKIIGPNEKCTEPYGTLSYVAPEVLIDEPYTKEVDLWSLGVISYLLLGGSLPFDHKTSEEEIARKTVMDPPSFKNSVWRTISPEAIDFVSRLLIKRPSFRMNIKEALEHEWFQKFYGNKLTIARRRSKESSHKAFELYSSVAVNDIKL